MRKNLHVILGARVSGLKLVAPDPPSLWRAARSLTLREPTKVGKSTAGRSLIRDQKPWGGPCSVHEPRAPRVRAQCELEGCNCAPWSGGLGVISYCANRAAPFSSNTRKRQPPAILCLAVH